MHLSPEDRAALRARANELRTEVSALTAERDAAFAENAQVVEDTKLIAEVAGLERLRDAAEAERNVAVSSTDDALAAMLAAVEREQAKTTALQNAGTSSPDTAPRTDAELLQPTLESAEKQALEEDAKTDSEPKARTRTNGGSR